MSDTQAPVGLGRRGRRSTLVAAAAGLLALAVAPSAQSQDLLVSPYLQNAATDSIHVMWETSSGEESLAASFPRSEQRHRLRGRRQRRERLQWPR